MEALISFLIAIAIILIAVYFIPKDSTWFFNSHSDRYDEGEDK